MEKLNLKRKYFTHSITSVVVVILIVVLINILAGEVFHRFDLTQDKAYSLSDSSKKVVKNLNDKVTIDVYFSQELPPEYLSLRQHVEDLLTEYQTYANGNLRINYIDPKNDEDLKLELQRKGIPELQFNILKKDEFQLTNGYLGIAVDYLDQEEVLPVIKSIANFEYDITSAIKKVSTDSVSKIAWAKLPEEKYSKVIEELQDDYDLTEVNLTQEQLLNNDYTTLVVAGIEENLDDKAQYAIDQFLMNGGSVLFMLDSVKVNSSLQAEANKTGLEDMLKNYGVILNSKMVLDQSNEMASFSGGFMTFMIPYPYWVKVQKNDFADDNAIVSELESLVLPWASSLEIEDNGENQVSYLVKSSEKSWLSDDSMNLDPKQDFTSQEFSRHTLAAAISGKFDSFFKDQDKSDKIDSTENGRIIVVGDADFVSDTFIANNSTNFLFLANAIDWLNQDEALISIRSKGVTDRSLKQLTDNNKMFIKYINIFGITIIVILVGLVRFSLRRNKRKKIKFSLK